MATAYVDITDARIDPDSPGETGLMTDIRNDLRHLKERADAVGINTLEGIHDNFTGDIIDTAAWETGGATAPLMDSQPDHLVHFITGVAAGSYAVMAAIASRMRFDLDRDHTLYMEVRHKSGEADAAPQWLFGFQDASLALSANTCITDQTDFIGFRQDAVANKYDAVCAKTSGGTLVVANSQGSAAAWTILRIEITFAGATKKVEFFIDGTSVGSTTDTAFITLVKLRPLLGISGGAGGTRNSWFDYSDFDWSVRPLSA